MQPEYTQVLNTKSGYTRAISRFCFALVLVLAFAVLAVNGASLLLGSFFAERPVLQLLLNDAGAYLVGLPLGWLILRTLPARPLPLRPKRTLSLSLFAGFACFCMTLAYAASFATMGLLQVLGLPQQSAGEEMMMQMAPLPTLLLVAVAPAILEEFIFRGLLYRYLSPYGEAPYVLLSGLLFGLFHGNLSQLFFAFALGCCFALLCYRTGTMVYGMLLHFLINFLSGNVLSQFLSPENEAGAMVIGMWMMAVIALGIAFACLRHKGLRLASGKNLPRHPLLRSFFNPGMLTFIIFVALLIFINYASYILE